MDPAQDEGQNDVIPSALRTFKKFRFTGHSQKAIFNFLLLSRDQ